MKYPVDSITISRKQKTNLIVDLSFLLEWLICWAIMD